MNVGGHITRTREKRNIPFRLSHSDILKIKTLLEEIMCFLYRQKATCGLFSEIEVI